MEHGSFFFRSTGRMLVAIAFAVSLVSCGGGGTPSFTVTATSNDGGSISPATQTVRRGQTATLTVAPGTGFHVLSVSGCGGTLAGNTYTTGEITANCTVTAAFRINSYTVTATAGEGGDITPQSVAVDHGDTTTFTVTPDDGFQVDAISGCNGVLTGDQYTTAPVVAACAVSVTFRLPAVSGSVHPAGATSVDSDVNDPNADFAPNDTAADAQPILNPTLVGGYVNEPGAGPTGRSHVDGDEVDVYRASLVEGQTIVLFIASGDVSDDLDLCLFDLDLDPVDCSLSATARVESVTVPQGGTGEYFIVVTAFSGSSRYLLSVGEPFADATPTMRLQDRFVEGEAIVRLHEDMPRPAAAGARRNHLFTLRTVPHIVAEAALVGDALQAVDLHLRRLSDFGVQDVDALRRFETLFAVKALHHDPSVEFAVPNYLHQLDGFTPNDPFYPFQWHYPQINLPEAWTLSTGNGVIVAVIDSGVLLDHPDLLGQFVPGYDFIDDVPGGNDPGSQPTPPGGSSFHGTHVAGTIATATGNSLMGAGVAFDARIMPLRVCTSAGCPAFAIEQALRFAAGLPNSSGTVPAQSADVVNLSLGRSGPPVASEQALYDELRALGLSTIAAAGNANTDTRHFPAAYDGVVAVGAVDTQNRRAFYSNFGDWIDLVAPGGDMSVDLNADGFPDGVLSTWADDRQSPITYNNAFLQGTSMAAPHVAGVVALMRSAEPALSADDILNLLANSALTDDLGPAGKDVDFGHGLINAGKAVTAAIETGGLPVVAGPRLEATPTRLNFGATRERLAVTLFNAGGGDLTLGTPSDDSGGWLAVELDPGEDNTIATVTVDREGLADALYTAIITFPSDANDVQVHVFMHVSEAPDRKIGLQYVILVTPDTLQTRHVASVTPRADGSFDFLFDAVQPGEYLMFSGSDADNDNFICGVGESCGLFRTFGEQEILVVDDEDIAGLEFSSGYDFVFDTATLDTAPDESGLRRTQRGMRSLH